jgi:NAD(P)-dependent dehydrogenase (short-subunit alcohol dehydrogenase family)
VVKKIEEAGGKAAAFQADVSDFKQAEALVKFAVETFGDLSILVNNAGITKDTLIMMMSETDWDSVITTNLKSTFNCSKAAVKHMMRKRTGASSTWPRLPGRWATPARPITRHPRAGRSRSPSRWRASRGAQYHGQRHRARVCRYRNP